jgi:glycosyltransferase involved in cell wall biosynthesis
VGRTQDSTENGFDVSQMSRVALVHDFLLDIRGGERVFLELCRLWPEADLYTALYDEDGTEGRFSARNVHTSYLQRLHPSARSFRTLLPLYPSAIESLDLSGYELVISSSSAWAHAVLCDERAIHVTYCHNPFRYAWNDRERTLSRQRNPLSRAILRGLFRRWRQWDWIAAQRSNRFVANSRTTQARIQAYFGRDSSIVHPPVETERFSPGPVGSHYLLVSELMPHKEIDIAVEAFNHLQQPLIVVGDGPDYRRLRRLAGRTVTLAGRLPDDDVARLLQGARALVVTAVEEFGIVAVESQAAGRPVIARRGGGALETIVEGVTGCLWSGGPRELARAVVEFEDSLIDPQACVGNAARFDAGVFRRRIVSEVEAAVRKGSQEGISEVRLRATRRPLRAAGSDRSR